MSMRGRKRLFGALLALAVALCGASAQVRAETVVDETPYVVNVYNERNGLPTGEANAIVQTADGYVFIGSYGGLIRYDGSTFYNYSTEGILPSSSVRGLFEDSQGRLWIGTNDAGVFYLEDEELHRVENPDPKSYLCVRGFDEGPDGVIYIASNSGMGEIRDGKLIAYSGEHTSGGTVYCVAVDNFGRVWGALGSGSCVVTQGGQELRVISPEELFDGLEIYCTATDRVGRVYLGSSGSVMARLSFPSESLEIEDIAVEYIDTPHVTTHNSIVAADNGWVIICGNVGACAIDVEGIEHPIAAEDGASSVNSGCVDYEGNIWLASSSSGVLKNTRGYFDSPNKAANLTDVAINAIVRSHGISFLGTNTGLLVFDEDWQPVENELTQLYAGARIRSLMGDSQGRVWVAAYVNQAPVTCYDPADGAMRVFTMDDGLVNSSARSLLELSDGRVAVGTQGGLSVIRDDQVVEGYTSEDGLAVSSVLCILESHDGSLLLGSDGGGIYEIRDGVVSNYGQEDGLADGVVLRMIRDEGRSGYFISAGSSLYYWNDGGFTKLQIHKGAGSIFDLFTQDGMLWIIQNSGILAFDRAQLLAGENPTAREFSFAHGLTGSVDANTWNWRDEDGSLYLCTRSGVSVFRFAPVSGTLPKAIISGVHTDDAFYSRPQGVEVESHVNRVTIDFAVLSFTETSKVGFSYTLEGFDEEETTVTGEKSGSVSYTNLPGGEYVFHLRVFLLEYPDLFEEYTLTIAKEPKLWELLQVKVLMVALLALFVALVVAMVYRAKIRGIQKRQQGDRAIIEQLLHTFARMIDTKDSYADGHSLRVAKYAGELARRMGHSTEEQENIYCVALLHDIGKISAPRDGASDAQEHPQLGGDALQGFTALRGVADGARYHHERYDGRGHRKHLAGEEIPLVARIIAVADAYDALCSDERGFTSKEIAEELRKGSGTQFDPEIVPHMLAMIEEGVVPETPQQR